MREMFCFQCQQTAHNTGCDGKAGVCGKKADTANYQDELIGALIGLARAARAGTPTPHTDELILKGLFTTITNVNFNNETILQCKAEIEKEKAAVGPGQLDDYDLAALWAAGEDVRSLKSLILFGLKGMAAYAYHARALGRTDPAVNAFFYEALEAIGAEKTPDELLALVFDTHAAVQSHSRTFDADAHHALARRAAAESIVLLKNENDLLPLAEGAKVAVIGDFAQTPRYQGAGSSAVNSIKVDTFLDCLKESGLASVGFVPGFDRQGKPDAAKQTEAVALAQKAEVVLLCLGLDEIKESEGLDRGDMNLADNQIELLKAVQQANPNTVVVLSAGASLETPWLKHCRTLVYGALGGQAGAGAMLDVLTGKVNPSGKLAETWVNAYADTPAKDNFAGPGRMVQYCEGLYVGYRYYQTAGVPVAFPFGYGLSYTSFAYSNLQAASNGVTLTVTNTGKRAGAEIVQLYVAKPGAEVFRPAQELKGFAKVQLQPGESKTVTIPLDDKAFRYWNTKTDSWEVEGGSYELRVGASSTGIRLTAVVEVAGTGAPNPYAGKHLPHYTSGKVQSVPDDEWATLLGRPVQQGKVKIDRNMTLGELNHSRSPLGWLIWLVLTALLNTSYKRGKPDLNVLFQYNMPLRALAKMTSGAISMGMVDGIVMELQGFWIIGLVRVIIEAVKNLVLNAQLEQRLRNS